MPIASGAFRNRKKWAAINVLGEVESHPTCDKTRVRNRDFHGMLTSPRSLKLLERLASRS